MNEPFDMRDVYRQREEIEQQQLAAKIRQIEFDSAMDLMHAQIMIANFNMTCFIYASMNPNLNQAALERIFGSRGANENA